MPHGRARERIDSLLVARGLVPTRTKAQALVLAGRVLTGGKPVTKPGERLPADAPLELLPGPRFVSRGGLKLAAALIELDVSAAGRDALDVGASTGGFTQALLAAGARRIVALDVGRGQLDWGLRNDPRVHPLEGVNARYLQPDDLPFRPTLAVVDVSFISLEHILPPVAACLDGDWDLLALVKPQFEIGRGRVGRGGIVREPELHREVLARVVDFLARSGLAVAGVCASSILGARGNREFFVHAATGAAGDLADELRRRIDDVVDGTGEHTP